MEISLHQSDALTSTRDDDHMVVIQTTRLPCLALAGMVMRLDLLGCDVLDPLGSREVVWVTVSRRDLVSLLRKLERPTPLRMAISLNTFRDGERADDVVLVLQVENDGWQRRNTDPELTQRRLDALLEWLFDEKEND